MTAVVVQQVPVTGMVVASQAPQQWMTGWCDMCADGQACCLAVFCPAILFGMNYAVTSSTFQPGTDPCQVAKDNCCKCFLGSICHMAATYYGLGWACGCWQRGSERAKYMINQGDCSDSCSDCLIHFFCCCWCALTQEWREHNKRAEFARTQPVTVSVPGMVMVQPQVQMVQPGAVYPSSPQGGYGQPAQYAQQPVVYQQQMTR